MASPRLKITILSCIKFVHGELKVVGCQYWSKRLKHFTTNKFQTRLRLSSLLTFSYVKKLINFELEGYGCEWSRLNNNQQLGNIKFDLFSKCCNHVSMQTYELAGSVKLNKTEERTLDDVGFAFVQKCIEVLESRGESVDIF